MRKIFLVIAAIALLCMVVSGGAWAATWDLFYNAALSDTGPTGNTVLRLSSPATGTDPYGYIRYNPATPFALNDLAVLSTDFNMVQGPFALGSPRFDIGLDFNGDGAFDWTNDRLIWTYWGTQPWGGGTPPDGWSNTGNFMDGSALWPGTKFFDGNTQYTAAELKAAFGNLNVMRAYVSLDGMNGQILDIANFTVNSDVYGPASPAVPEPISILLGFTGLGSIAGFRRLRRK